MQLERAFVSFLHLLVVFLFLGLGAFFCALPFLPEVRMQLAHILLGPFGWCTEMGLGFFFGAMILFLGFYRFERGRVLCIRMGNHQTSIRKEVIEKTLEECFKNDFGGQIRLSDVSIFSKKKLEIGVTIPSLNEEDREALFVKAQKALQPLLEKRFGYVNPFFLLVKSIE